MATSLITLKIIRLSFWALMILLFLVSTTRVKADSEVNITFPYEGDVKFYSQVMSAGGDTVLKLWNGTTLLGSDTLAACFKQKPDDCLTTYEFTAHVTAGQTLRLECDHENSEGGRCLGLTGEQGQWWCGWDGIGDGIEDFSYLKSQVDATQVPIVAIQCWEDTGDRSSDKDYNDFVNIVTYKEGTVVIPTPTPTATLTPTLTPTPAPGSIRVRAGLDKASCSELYGGSFTDLPSALDGITVNGLSGGAISGNEKIWTNVPSEFGGKQYSISASPPANFSPGLVCHQDASGIGPGSQATLGPGETVTWRVGYKPPDSWVQTQGGDVYASLSVSSSIPSGSGKPFSLAGASGIPGVVFYGVSASFGGGVVSSKNWLAKDTFSAYSTLYSSFYTLLGSPTTPVWSGGSPPGCSLSPCIHYATGSQATSGDWTIGSTQQMIIFVDGSLTINGKIQVDPGGFLAFIAKNGITIGGNVGTTTASSTNPVLEGVYITNNDFDTGSGAKKLVARGMFIADRFLLRRNLGGAENVDNPSELFIYDPRFLVSMPEEMRESVLQWQEVNP